MAESILVVLCYLFFAHQYEEIERLKKEIKEKNEELEKVKEQRKRILSNTELVVDVLYSYNKGEFVSKKKNVIAQLKKGIYDAKYYGTDKES